MVAVDGDPRLTGAPGPPLAVPSSPVAAAARAAALRPVDSGPSRPAVGALAAAFGPPGKGRMSGVQLVHVDAAGLPAPDRPGPEGLTKRSHGSLASAICVFGLPVGAQGIHVAEGLADALALAARLPWPAVCMGGTAGYRNQALAANPSIEKVARGADPGAAGAPLAEIHGGAWGEYAADLQRDGLQEWEARRVASVMLPGGGDDG